jgi:hypothetical protein
MSRKKIPQKLKINTGKTYRILIIGAKRRDISDIMQENKKNA